MLRTPLSEQLRTAREEARLSVSELARRAKTSRAAIYAYESGEVSPSLQTAQRVLAAAGYELVVVPAVLSTVPGAVDPVTA